MSSPISATAYPAPTQRLSRVDLFGQTASGQDLAMAAGVTGGMGAVSAADETQAKSAENKQANPMFGKDGFTFGDFLDIINPLQHIPIVSTIYRAVTGDKIDPGARIIGGGVFGGPIGLVASLVSGIVEDVTGKDPGEHALAALGIDIGPNHNKDAADTTVASEPSAQPDSTISPDLAAASQPQAMLAQAQAAQSQPAQERAPSLKLGVKKDDGRSDQAVKDAGKAEARPEAAIELPADLFQALKQTAAAQQAETRSAATNAATANPAAAVLPASQPRQPAPMQTNAVPNTAIQPADGRTWFPAHPMGGGGVPTRGVGTNQVTQLNATSKFGSARPAMASPHAATAAAAATVQNTDPQQNEWANRAGDAYQKYFEMQEQKNLRSGITRGGVPAF